MSSNIFYQWQNKKLRDTIYPFREMKLRDFLLIYKEVDLWTVMKNQRTSDPAIANRLQDIRQKIRAEYDQVAAELNAAIAIRRTGRSGASSGSTGARKSIAERG